MDGTTAAPISESVSLKEWWTGHHPWHEAGKSRSQASTLSTGSGTVYKRLTYISRMLQLLSLSMEGINPHEGERHIQALVTEWHLAEDWTPRPCPPHYMCHRAIIFVALHTVWCVWEPFNHELYKICFSLDLGFSLVTIMAVTKPETRWISQGKFKIMHVAHTSKISVIKINKRTCVLWINWNSKKNSGISCTEFN